MPNLYDPLAPAFHALADPTRRAVLARLALGPATVSELAAPYGMALPSFMQHLAVLEAGGLIASEKLGRSRICRLEPAMIGRVEGWLSTQRRLWEGRTDRLQAFLEQGGDLAMPPATEGKKDERP
jgi:DNA-binding transcriptional ArsR family regulator